MIEDNEYLRDNLVGKFYSILIKLKKSDGGKSIKITLSNALLPNPNNNIDLHFSIGLFFDLINRAKAVLSESNLRKDLWEKHFDALQNLFTHCVDRLSDSWSSISDKISNEALTALEFCANHISISEKEKHWIDDDSIATLDEEFAHLFTLVSESVIDEKLKMILQNNIEAGRRAIFEYRLYGNDQIETRFKLILSDLAINGNEIQKQDKSLWNSVWKVMTHFKDSLVLLNAGNQAWPILTHEVIKLIQPN